MEISNVIKVQENGLSVIDFEALELLSSNKFRNKVSERLEDCKLFNASMRVLDNGYIFIRGLNVPKFYADWETAVNDMNCTIFEFGYIPKDNSRDEFINFNHLYIHNLKYMGINVVPNENQELVK